MDVTNGRGVDVVLNSLTGPGFKEATLSVCARNGRFVEMSKMAVWTKEEVKSIRSDVAYYIVELNHLEPAVKSDLFASVKDLFNMGVLQALPYVQFDALRVRQAFQYFQKAKHIGKVVVTMPEVNTFGNRWRVNIPLFNDESTYLITGGLGGIGFEVCKWMLSKGATDIVLIGRRPPTLDVAQEIYHLNHNEGGKLNVVVKLGDVGNKKELEIIYDEVLATCKKPIRGVHHCAGVLCDGLYETQTSETFLQVYQPKIQGTWNIHNLTKDLLLEHFVMYSSISALVGTPAQANYSSANCFLDAFTNYRYSKGLPATSINWGQWSQVGCAKELNIPGLLPVSIKRMLNGLEEVLRGHRLQTTIAEFDNFGMWNALCPSFKHYMDEKLLKSFNESGSSAGHYALPKSDQFWKEIDTAASRSEKIEIFMTYTKNILRSSLRMDANESINVDANFGELGVDSLLLVELKNSIQSLLGSRLLVTANMLKDCNTIRQLAMCIMTKLYDENNVSENPSRTPEELKKLIANDCMLGDDIQPVTEVACSSIKNVFLTGYTGQLGPYVISSLMSKLPSVEQIICLIRNKEEYVPKEKLQKVFNKLNLTKSIDFGKLNCVIGDIAKPYFGLGQEEYNKLAGLVDSVVHLAVKSNHVEEYAKYEDDSYSDIRSVNVGGTLNVLKFATTSKTKYVYYASSIMSVIFGNSFYESELSDNWPEKDGINLLVENKITGYPISKFVCEMLLKEACNRGIPCKLFRFPWITGESGTGQLNYINNHYILRMLSYLKIKAMPESALPALVLPVDICADLSVEIFLNHAAPNEIYNIVHPRPELELEFVKIAKEDFNVEISLVDWSSEEFMKMLYANGMPLESLQDIYEDVDRVVSITTSASFKTIQGYYANPETFFQNSKVDKLIPGFAKSIPTTMEIIKRDLRFVKATGFLKQFGL